MADCERCGRFATWPYPRARWCGRCWRVVADELREALAYRYAPVAAYLAAGLGLEELARTPDHELLKIRLIGPAAVARLRRAIPYRGSDGQVLFRC